STSIRTCRRLAISASVSRSARSIPIVLSGSVWRTSQCSLVRCETLPRAFGWFSIQLADARPRGSAANAIRSTAQDDLSRGGQAVAPPPHLRRPHMTGLARDDELEITGVHRADH